jgi:hypothetical protein
MRLIVIVLVFVYGSFLNLSAQINGKATNLPGIWKYDGGSGFEIWEMVGDDLVGSGYRTSKLNDTVKVEDLRISKTKNHLFYTLITHQQTQQGVKVVEHKFIGGKRKMYFENLDVDGPNALKYTFGIFNKDKLTITIEYEGKKKPIKLKLRRVSEI